METISKALKALASVLLAIIMVTAVMGVIFIMGVLSPFLGAILIAAILAVALYVEFTEKGDP